MKDKIIFSAVFVALLACASFAQTTLPYKFDNKSTYAADQIYIAVIGIVKGKHVWLDPKTGALNDMAVSDNTVQGPVIGGNRGPGLDGKYADCFRKLSEIPNATVNVPSIAGSRLLISFNSPLYMYFFGNNGGFAAPNLADVNDPNQGVRFETIELTYNEYGLWTNTTRVDSYQLPMGLEVTGQNSFYKKTGELMNSASIISAWKNSVSPAFLGCLKEAEGIIMAPSKIQAFQENGAHKDHFKPYVDAVWEKYKTEDLTFTSGAGIWKGRVEGERFVFHNQTNFHGNATGIVSRRPNTQEILEGKGVLAEDVQKLTTQTLDLVVQAQICAAFNRHAIDLNAPNGATQDWSDSSKFFKVHPYNEYVKFWHRADVSFEQSSYGFCYDDVYDFSSTIHTPKPTSIKVTIGGFYDASTAIRNELKPTKATPNRCFRNGAQVNYTKGDFGNTGRSYNVRGAIVK